MIKDESAVKGRRYVSVRSTVLQLPVWERASRISSVFLWGLFLGRTTCFPRTGFCLIASSHQVSMHNLHEIHVVAMQIACIASRLTLIRTCGRALCTKPLQEISSGSHPQSCPSCWDTLPKVLQAARIMLVAHRLLLHWKRPGQEQEGATLSTCEAFRFARVWRAR